MTTLKKLQGNVGREQSSGKNTYRGIPMFCDTGLHEACFEYLQHIPKQSKILVLGSGSGAFDQRLVDAGFSEVTSIDFRPDFFRASGTTFIERDLNRDWSDLGIFDCVVAIELIEHMENPAHFMRSVASCLSEHGTAIVTTPNIESGPSRIGFLTLGRIMFFTEEDLRGSGHISPLPVHIFKFHAESAGLHIKHHTYNRGAWSARLLSNIEECLSHLKSFHLVRAGIVAAKTAALLLLSPFAFRTKHRGNIHIYEIAHR